MGDTFVRPLLRILANGRRRDPVANKSWLKFTVIATPEPVAWSAGSIDFADWPSQMATRLQNGQAPFDQTGIAALVRPITATALPDFEDPSWTSVPLVLSRRKAFANTAAWTRISALWRTTIELGGDDAWRILADDIAVSLAGSKRKVDLKDCYSGTIGGSLAEDGAIVNQQDTAQQVEIQGVLPIRQTDIAIEQESERAARVLRKQLKGPFAVPSGDLLIPDAKPPADRFTPVTLKTDPERERSSTTNAAATSVLNGEEPGEANAPLPAACVVPAAGTIDPPAQVAGRPPEPADPERERRRATHQYGTWLQRQDGKGKEGSTVDKTSGLAKRSEKIRGAYFALQGDPVLSRLFCLAFDFEIDEDLIPPALRDRNLHLALPMAPDADRRVITAARHNENAFWPVSAFEAKVVRDASGNYAIVNKPDMADQRDGIWRLGTELAGSISINGEPTAVTVPRYDLPSLDMRRSLDSKTTGQDLGEPHHTGGLAILDRGRADQIARDLALATSHSEDGNTIILHAEELTIGRRVDIAAVPKAGSDLATLKWRSLMHRYVDFDFDKADATVEGVLKELIPQRHAKKGILEEVSFQVAARYMPTAPTPEAAAAPVEVVAEEALFVWDGTPAGVLTDPGNGNRTTASGLPFDRVLDLPSSTDGIADLIPAPLRFGARYVARVRSMFQGGGSPGATADDTRLSTGADQVLPGTKTKAAKPRRFLRHEPINAPIALLPAHLVERRYAEMGYELVDQAIIRTHNATETELDEGDEPNIFRGEYVAASTRAQPTNTMRVFIPPQVAVGLVARHRKLDTKDRGKVLKGGLTDVAFAPARTDGAADQLTASGFPVAVTYRRDALDTDGAIYRRRLSSAKSSSDRGVPVFEPGGENETSGRQIGYLPDPAATNYSIRAKFRGSDRYLTGDTQVAVYDGTSYPDVLPLVIGIRRPDFGRNSLRKKHPEAISDLKPSSSIAWMDVAGKIFTAKTKGTARVRYVEFILHPGEDYDLEVACLPTADELREYFSLPETMAIQLHAAITDPPGIGSMVAAICGTTDFSKLCAATDTQSLTGIAGLDVPVEATLDNVAKQLLDTIRTKWPIEELASVTKLRIAHAVDKPMLAADWLGQPVAYRRDAKTANDGTGDIEGAQDLVLDGQIEVDLGLVESIQIVAMTTAIDGSALDPTERGRSSLAKRSGRWPKRLNPDGSESLVPIEHVLGFDVSAKGEVTLPQSSVTLLTVGNLPVAGAVGAILPKDTKPVFGDTKERRISINLAPLFAAAGSQQPIKQEIAGPAGATARPSAVAGVDEVRNIKVERPHLFKDTLARRLRLSVVAVSRHASAFETEPAYFEGREQALYRRQPLKRKDQALKSLTEVEIWMNSSKRPLQPDVRRPEPSFSFERRHSKGEYTLVRTARTRLYLGRNWYSSGDGERLGIILWPPRYRVLGEFDVDRDDIAFGGRTLRLRDFDDADLGEAGAFVTRWGGDPIRLDPSPQSGNFIPPTAFGEIKRIIDKAKKPSQQPRPHDVHDAILEDEVRIPIRRPQSAETATVNFDYVATSLLTYTPCFDIDREEWYVDVDLNPNRASEPFVRFGLVRYQKHAIDGLQCSEPVSVFTQLLPERTISVSLDKVPVGEKVTVKVSGLGSLGIKPIAIPPTPGHTDPVTDPRKLAFDSLAMPKMRLSVFHERTAADTGLVRTPLVVTADEFLQEPGPGHSEEDHPFWIVEPTKQNTTLEWESSFRVTPDLVSELGPGVIAAYVEEVDRRMPSFYRNEPIPPGDMFNTKSFVYSGPRFSGRVPFLSIEGADD